MSGNEFREGILFFPGRKPLLAFIKDEEQAVGRENSLGSDSQSWPGLPAKSSPDQLGLHPASCWSRRRSLKFSLGEVEWPSLDSRRGSPGAGAGAGAGAGTNPDLLSCKSPAPSSGPGGGAERVDIPGIKGSTRITSRQADAGGESPASSSKSRQCKGWMRLPPIVMPSSPTSPSSSSSSDSPVSASKRLRNSQDESPEERRSGSKPREGGAGCCSSQEPAEFPPVYLMLNKDFVVISPLKENLLLTLALTEKRPTSPRSDNLVDSILFLPDSEPELLPELLPDSPDPGSPGSADGKRARRHVFVGRFEAFSSFVRFGLGRDAMRVVTEANAGGTSTISESLSVEYFVRKFQAKDVVTEMEVEYCAMNWKKVDYICSLYDQRVGVSVTRAMSYPNPEEFTIQMAERLLTKKLFGLVVARHGVTERHSFSQCILHVWCETTTTAKLLQEAYKEVSEELDITDDVIMVLTVAEGWHARPIFYESCLERS